MSQGDCVGTQNPIWTTPISRHGQQFDICFPSYHQAPIDVTAGWAASPVYARSQFNSWVNWSNMRNVSSKKITTTPKCLEWESNLQPLDQQANTLTWLCCLSRTHTRADTHARMRTLICTHTYAHKYTHVCTPVHMHAHTHAPTRTEKHTTFYCDAAVYPALY